jgi:plasmid stability protein
MSQTVTMNLPSELYVRIKKRADEAHRSVEEEAVEMLGTTAQAADAVPADLRQSLASLELLDNAAVERAARGRFAVELAAEVEALHFKRQREGLTDAEKARCAELIEAYERSMLIRAHATALLKERGVEILDSIG